MKTDSRVGNDGAPSSTCALAPRASMRRPARTTARKAVRKAVAWSVAACVASLFIVAEVRAQYPIGPGVPVAPGGVLLPAPVSGRLVAQEAIPNPPLEAVDVTLDNPGKETIVARVYHLRSPGRGTEHKLKPGQAVDLVFDRDSGGVLRQTYEIRRFGGLVERRNVDTPIPPKSLYTVVVFAERTTYKYIDRTGKSGGLPNFDSASLVSLGVISLPPGDALASGAVLDLPQEAAARRNPGAAAAFEPPLPLLDRPAARDQEAPPAPTPPPPSRLDPTNGARPPVGPPPESPAVPPPPPPQSDAAPSVAPPRPGPQPQPVPPPRPAGQPKPVPPPVAAEDS